MRSSGLWKSPAQRNLEYLGMAILLILFYANKSRCLEHIACAQTSTYCIHARHKFSCKASSDKLLFAACSRALQPTRFYLERVSQALLQLLSKVGGGIVGAHVVVDQGAQRVVRQRLWPCQLLALRLLHSTAPPSACQLAVQQAVAGHAQQLCCLPNPARCLQDKQTSVGRHAAAEAQCSPPVSPAIWLKL